MGRPYKNRFLQVPIINNTIKNYKKNPNWGSAFFKYSNNIGRYLHRYIWAIHTFLTGTAYVFIFEYLIINYLVF